MQRAKDAGFRSRAAFKLIEILDSHKKITFSRVLDLGAAPGGWSQVLARDKEAAVLALDLQEMRPIENVRIIRGDFTTDLPEVSDLDLITSDMAPPASGDRRTDHQRLMNLCHLVLDFIDSGEPMRRNGSLIMKISQGGQEKELIDRMKTLFTSVKLFKPRASRLHSSEIYSIGLGYLGQSKL